MKLEDALSLLSSQHPIFDYQQLSAFAQLDHEGGRDTGKYPVEVSINSVEGQFLYAVSRLLVPDTCLEIGTADGCSAAHLLQALHDNQHGRLVSIDIDPTAGRLVTGMLRERWTFVHGDARSVELPHAQVVFEDGAHDYDSTRVILLRLRELNPKIIISHDYFRHLYDPNVGVKRAFDEVFGGEVIAIHFDDTRTGMGVWVNRGALP